MDPKQQTAAVYYNQYKKRSFFYSRIIVGVSMLFLVIALAVNVFFLSSQETSTSNTHAANKETMEKLLPSLASGCHYQQTQRGLSIACPTATPTYEATIPIKIALPELPSQCAFATSSQGDEIHCTPSHAPIPIVPIQLPANCSAATTTDTLICKDVNKKESSFSLPSLPKGCSYQKEENNYFVVCQPK